MKKMFYSEKKDDKKCEKEKLSTLEIL